MDFGSYPPEINSARMYTGAGAGPLVVAAEAWDALAGELQSVANSYQSVVSGLTAGPWMGPASTSMSAAAASYAAWLRTTAEQAEQTGAQAKSAAAAYQAAFTATVPPPMVAANRSLLSTLIATNLFGRNTQAIAANEAQYGEMWAQDAAAMYGYAASSAAATQLSPFNPPQHSTNPTGEAAQSTAVGQATGTAAGNVQSTVSSIQQAFSSVPNALQGLSTAAPAASTAATAADPLSTLSNLISIFLDAPAAVATFAADIPFGVVGVTALPLDIIGAGTGLHTDKIISGWAGQEPWPGQGYRDPTAFPAIITGPIESPAATTSLSAGLGEANTVGALSVPPTWTIATPAVRPVAMTLPALPGTGAVAAAEVGEAGSSGVFAEMAVASMAGRAIGGTLGTGAGKGGAGTRAPARPAGTGRAGSPAVADVDGDAAPTKSRAVVTGVAAELREFAKLRDEGILTDEEYTEQKNRLLGR
jgi:PPE-repeat protein